MKGIWAVLGLLLLAESVLGVRINEVMYNPEGTDDNQEFVEVYGISNLTGYIVGDLSSNDTLELLRYIESNHSLIVEEGFNHSGISASVYSAGAAIGNGLGNSGDAVILYFNNTLIDNMSYDGSLADDNGFSMEYYNGSFQESNTSGGTPGDVNSLEVLQANRTESVTNITGNGNAPINVNTTNSSTLLNSTDSSAISQCSISLNTDTSKKIYDQGETVIFTHSLTNESVGFLIEYKTRDIFGNILREARNTSNTNPKQFTPKLGNEPVMAYEITSRLVSVNCSNNSTKTEDIELVVVKGISGSCSEDFLCKDYLSELGSLRRQLESAKISSSGDGGGGGVFVPAREEASIESLYTRKKNYEPVIKLFSRVKGRGFHYLALTAREEDYNRSVVLNSSETYELEVRASQGRNIYVLELLDTHGKILDIEKLIVEFPVEKEVVTSTAANAVEAEEQEYEEKTVMQKTSTVTGKVVYESKESASSWLIGSSVLLVVVLAGTAFYSMKDEGKKLSGKATFIKRLLLSAPYGKRRTPRKAGRGLDKDKHDIRDGREPSRIYREYTQELYREHKD